MAITRLLNKEVRNYNVGDCLIHLNLDSLIFVYVVTQRVSGGLAKIPRLLCSQSEHESNLTPQEHENTRGFYELGSNRFHK